MPGVTCVAPTAAFYAMPRVALPPGKTDEDYVLALLRATGVLCVYGSGFGLPADDGFLRIVFLAPLDELREIYDLMADVHRAVSEVLGVRPREFCTRRSDPVIRRHPRVPSLTSRAVTPSSPRSLSGADDRADVAAGARPHPRPPRRLRRSAVQHVGDGVGGHAPGARLVEREHLRPASALARVLGALPPAGAAGPADLSPRRTIPILGYNLLFLSTFVLSGLGMFLLGRELTGSRAAGFVAGLAFAFSPFRFASMPHLQVLSSAWMPFVLFGLRRYFVTGRRGRSPAPPPHGSLQNLSCGYYLLFFSPVVVMYIAWEMTTRGLWTDRGRSFASASRARWCWRRFLSCSRTWSCGGLGSARVRWPRRCGSPRTSTRTSPPIPTCGCGDRSRARGRRPKARCFPV